MNSKVLSLVLAAAMLPGLTDAVCTTVCDAQGPISVGYCMAKFPGDSYMIRACCLREGYCPNPPCSDWINVTKLETMYSPLDAIMHDHVDQICDCIVVDCVKNQFNPADCPQCSVTPTA